MKAIIEVSKAGATVNAARQQLAASRRGVPPDFRLSFESARSLFADLTPARVDLLDTLRRVGPCSVHALAKAAEPGHETSSGRFMPGEGSGHWPDAACRAERNYSNVHTDVARLEVLGLIDRTEDGSVLVPYESVEILLPLAQVA